MGNKSFKFKQFEIFHDKTAMKVGTDGVLLGAWVDLDNATSVLDVGTGTGLIALMVAQRSKEAVVRAIEIDKDAAEQAKENVRLSSFADRVEVEMVSFQHFVAAAEQKFDVVVSNPPFFVDALHAPDEARTNARHNTTLSIYDLLELGDRLLNPNGRLAVVYPADHMEQLLLTIAEKGWYLLRQTDVYTTVESKSPKRVLLELCREVGIEGTVNRLVIEERRHQYTREYVELTQDFYLKM